MTGFQNVISGIEHFPSHVVDFFKSSESGILGTIVGGAVAELIAFEKTHGKEQLEAAKLAGEATYKIARAAGEKVGPAIIAGVAAGFEAVIPDVVSELKTLSTQAMTALIASIVGKA